MELKLGYSYLSCSKYFSSNRTFMELKYKHHIDNTPPSEGSNRTFMELK